MFLKYLYHFILIKRSGLFDHHYYLQYYPDVRRNNTNPIMHYIKFGWKEGRNPSQQFNTLFYLRNNIDVEQTNINPLIHYILFGKKENRKTTDENDVLFSGQFRFKAPDQTQITDTEVYIRTVRPQNHFQPNHIHYSQQISPFLDDLTDKELHFDEQLSGLEKHENKVSIIIPTKNAGHEFNFLLKMLLYQKGIQEIEIIVVDSGSTDDTVSIAQSYQAKVIEISPEEFSHSFARNLGAQTASGDFLLFTVQDALPPSKTWLYSLLSTLKDKDVSAVSCAEFPRENADLFYRVISWNHYNFLGVNNCDRVLSMPDNTNHVQLRKNGQLSDLACLIKRDLFNNYQYRLSYAEDLDLGIRLIKDGHRLAFLGTIRIIHSHNRSAFYFLKRGYVDIVFLSEVFSDYETPKLEFQNTARDIIFMFKFLSTEIINEISELDFPVRLNRLKSFINQKLIKIDSYKYLPKPDLGALPIIDSEILDFVKILEKHIDSSMDGNCYDGMIASGLLGYINITFNYLSNILEIVDRKQVQEIVDCIIKELAIVSGSHLAYAYKRDTGEERELLNNINDTLKQGV